jgi:hypothetical protein
MKPHRWLLALVLLESVTLFSAAQAAPETSDPAAVVKALYKLDIKQNGFDAATVKSERSYLAPEIYARLLKILNQPVAEGDEGPIDEDLILNAQDEPTKYSVGQATIEHDTAKVPVDLAWDADKQHYIVYLKQFDGAWKVTEIDYGKDGKLTNFLK